MSITPDVEALPLTRHDSGQSGTIAARHAVAEEGGFEPSISPRAEAIFLHTVCSPGASNKASEQRLRRSWDQRFESPFLQRRVIQTDHPVAERRVKGRSRRIARARSNNARPGFIRQNLILTNDNRTDYRAPSQAGPSNDINAGSPGSQKAPTRSPASLVAIRARLA